MKKIKQSDSSSSSEGEGLPWAPHHQSPASKKSAVQKKPTEANAVSDGHDSDDSVSDSLTTSQRRSKPPVKRAVALNAEDSKKPKKGKVEAGKVEEEGKKSALIQRLWSEDDEIAILKGMLDYEEERAANPLADGPAFHEFIKKSLHVEVEPRQVVDKIRKMKRKYQNSLVKKKSFSPHEQTAFDLSTKIWGSAEDGADVGKQSKSAVKTRTVANAGAANGLGPNCVSTNNADGADGGKRDVDSKDEEGKSWQFIGNSCMLLGLDENIVKVGLDLCRQDMKAELEEKWKQLYVEESSLFLRKFDLVRQESKMITEAFKSSCDK